MQYNVGDILFSYSNNTHLFYIIRTSNYYYAGIWSPFETMETYEVGSIPEGFLCTNIFS